MINEILTIVLARMPDLYLRISVTTKAATLGIGMLLACAALHFKDQDVTSRALAIILFLLLTAPVGAHLLGRASYFVRVPMWENSVMDDLEGKYEAGTQKLSSEEEAGDEPASG